MPRSRSGSFVKHIHKKNNECRDTSGVTYQLLKRRLDKIDEHRGYRVKEDLVAVNSVYITSVLCDIQMSTHPNLRLQDIVLAIKGLGPAVD